jgi:cephalosporin hydroxylase
LSVDACLCTIPPVSGVRDLIPKPIRSARQRRLSQKALLEAETRGLEFGKRMVMSDAPAPSSRRPSQLESYFDEHTTGPGIWKWRHYFDIYHRHLAKFIGREVNVVEIGVFSGGSMAMWLDYFGSGCKVYGVDIQQACKAYERDSVEIFIGDQSDPEFWKDFVQKVPRIDVVIDDGSHLPDHQIATFESLFTHVSPGGVYLCEDVHNVRNRFHQYVCGLSRNMNTKNGPTGFQSMVDSIHTYPFVTVVERPSVPLLEMTSEKHGTQWQPLSFIDVG